MKSMSISSLGMRRLYWVAKLIADLHMPFLDGLELYRLVRREMPQTKLLLIGSNATAEELQMALELLSAVDHLPW
jgi:CheY-like chemotaxis protein